MSNVPYKSMSLCSGLVAVFAAAPAAAQSPVCFDVSLRGGTAEICAAVYENAEANNGRTILAVHGFTETAATWEPLADAMFANNQLSKKIARVVAIDLPGHGASAAPVGLPGGLFGNLTINDNVAIVIQSIDLLAAEGLAPGSIMGHSMGGLEVQGAQEALLAQGSSLAAHGVSRAILVAPVPAGNAPWTQPPPSNLAPFVVTSADLGSYLNIPPFIARLGGGFTTQAGTLVSGTPSVAEMPPYVGFEPIVASLQLVGQVPGLPRPSVREGAFAPQNGTQLTLISFSQDILTPQVDHDDLYLHLVGHSGSGFEPVVGPEAVHSMHITDPAGVLNALNGLPSIF